jgi:MFS family permease
MAFYLASRFLWTAADQVVVVAVGWTVYDTTESAWALGLVGLAAFVPRLLMTLAAGMIADRYDRRRIIGAGLALNALLCLGLMLVVLRPEVRIGGIYVMFLLFGTVRGFVGPASQALVANLVPREEFSRAVSLASSTGQVARIVGPALGGLIFILGAFAPFACAAGFYAAGALLNQLLRTRGQVLVKAPPRLAEAFEGLHFIRRQPVLLGAISMDLFAVLLGGAVALLPIIAHDLLDAGPLTLGVLRAMPSLGAAMVGAALALVPLRRHAGYKLFAATAVFGLATIGLGLSQQLWLSLAFLWVIGASDVFSVVIRQTLVQINTPDEMRGRVSAVNMLFVGASNELGEFESGATAALFGLVPAIVLGGVGTLAVTALWAVWFPALLHRDHLVDEP